MKLETQLKNAQDDCSRLERLARNLQRQVDLISFQNSSLKSEIVTQKEYAEALKKGQEMTQDKLTIAIRAIRIVKATMNGLVIEGEDTFCSSCEGTTCTKLE